MIVNIHKKDLDELTTSSIDVSSNDDTELRVTDTIVAASVPGDAQLVTGETFDDVDEDEAFINELMAMHPNDEDLIVEDLEAIPIVVTLPEDVVEDVAEDVPQAEEAVEEGVRQKLCR